jgi:hypothetical protein
MEHANVREHMIEHLRVAKTANFYRLGSRMTNTVVDEMFRKVRGVRDCYSCHPKSLSFLQPDFKLTSTVSLAARIAEETDKESTVSLSGHRLRSNGPGGARLAELS